MEQFLVTQSLIASWAYMFDCHEDCEKDARNDFLRVLRRESAEPTDAMKAGIIYNVKFFTKPLSGYEAYGKYLNSPQHPFYFYLVPEAAEFKYLLSDGKDLYIESYKRNETERIEVIIQRFIHSISEMNMLGLYKEKWLAK